MASKGKKAKRYTADHKVDEWLLNQVVKHVNHEEIGSLARDLFVEESVYSNITREKDRTFKVRYRRKSLSSATQFEKNKK